MLQDKKRTKINSNDGWRKLSLLAVTFSITAFATPAFAQEDVSEEDQIEEVVVTGTRQVIQDSIDLKRNSTQIVDGISAAEIGDLPALSIGEALESITGAASHRENGGATEVSIRGLGPYLSSTVVNGRAATNGSGDRSVNFSQFPSELVNKLAIFKTQDASQIEGGVAGQIQIETLKPLEYGKRRIQAEIKGNYNPDQANQEDTEAGDFGYRGTLSYVDQFETGLGDIGISIGGQRSDISQPEAESRSTSSTSSSRPACLISNGAFFALLDGDREDVTGFSNNPARDDDCDDVNGDRNLGVVPSGFDIDVEGNDTQILNGEGVDAGIPFVFAPSQRHYRQNDTRDERDAFFGGFQWQPSDSLDVNLDVQWSERLQSERRNDLTFNGGRRNDTSLNIGPGGTTTTLDSLVYTDSGAILRSITDNTIEIQGGDWQRLEEYLGGGINIDYDVSDRLSVSADFAHSNTRREEQAIEFRIQSDITPVIEFDRRGSDVPLYTLYDEEFDVNDHSNFVDRLRVRVDNDRFRDNTIDAARFDFDFELDGGFFKNIQGGVRLGVQDYLELPGGVDSRNPLAISSGRFSFEIENDGELTVNNQEVIDDNDDNGVLSDEASALQDALVAIIGSTNEACQTSFQEDGFLSSVRDDDLVTNIADDGSIISSTNTWATFDATCVAQTAANSLNNILAQINAYLTNPDAREASFANALGAFSAGNPDLIRENSRTIDVKETTKSVYAMTGYETSFNGWPITGNMGVRVVQTDVDAVGYRPELIVTQRDDGTFNATRGNLEAVSLSNSYTEILPSANAIIELSEDKVLRFGIFKALSRPDPADMGFGRSINLVGSADGDEEDEGVTTIEGLVNNVGADGNPALDALTSWNYDVGFEWYPNDDSIFALSAYYKKFQGGFENIRTEETFRIGGVDVVEPVSVQQVSDETSGLFGVEFTGSHNFSYLPGAWSGLGAKISYNYVNSTFEFEDSRYGDSFRRELDGSLTQLSEGIIAPGGLPGLSNHVFSGQLYYQIGNLDLQANYKYRDSYFQPFTSDGTRLRYVGDVGVWEARASYQLNDTFRLQVDAINLFSEPKNQYAYVTDDLYEVNDYGPRIFFGIRGKW